MSETAATATTGDDQGDEPADGGPTGIGGDYQPPEWLSLDPDEEVVWVGQPSLSSLVGTVVTGVVTIPLLVGIVILLALPFSYLSIDRTDFVVTTKSLYVKKGVLSTNIETVDIDKIQNTEYSQSFWGKQLGYGNIEISTAGSSGADITFQAIENARAVRERISELGARSSGRSEKEAESSGDAPQLQELVAELRATREALERIERKLADGSAESDRDGSVETPTDGQQSADER